MYFDERMKISDEKEKPLGKGAFQGCREERKMDTFTAKIHNK